MKRLLLSLSILCLIFAVSVDSTASRNGQGEIIEVPATFIQSPMNVTVILPEGYYSATDTHYPVVYLLNGYSGDHTSWPGVNGLDSLATQYGMILVCPDGRDSWYWDSPIDSTMQMESFITKELIPYIDSNYRTIADADHRAITGLSMGGHGALWLAMRHSDLFGAAGSTSGGVNIIPFPKNWKMAQRLGDYETNKDIWESHTVINLVDSLQPGELNIIFDCGSEDFFAEVNADLHAKLLDKKIPHDYISRPGKHNWAYWSNSILYQLLYFNEFFNAR